MRAETDIEKEMISTYIRHNCWVHIELPFDLLHHVAVLQALASVVLLPDARFISMPFEHYVFFISDCILCIINGDQRWLLHCQIVFDVAIVGWIVRLHHYSCWQRCCRYIWNRINRYICWHRIICFVRQQIEFIISIRWSQQCLHFNRYNCFRANAIITTRYNRAEAKRNKK